MLTNYEKLALRRITKHKSDEEIDAIGQDDTLAREYITALKEVKLQEAEIELAEALRIYNACVFEKEIWENV